MLGKIPMIDNLKILLVEDDDVAAESVQRSLKKAGLDIPIVVAENGQVGLDVLRNQHPELRITMPYVVLLDLNMPLMNGFEFLEQLRSDQHLCGVVVFVLTTSNAESDRTRAYHNNVAGYMVKAAVGPQFAKLASLLDAYQNAVELQVSGSIVR